MPDIDYRDLLVRYMAAVIHVAGVPFYGRNAVFRCFTQKELQILDEIDIEARKMEVRES